MGNIFSFSLALGKQYTYEITRTKTRRVFIVFVYLFIFEENEQQPNIVYVSFSHIILGPDIFVQMVHRCASVTGTNQFHYFLTVNESSPVL